MQVAMSLALAAGILGGIWRFMVTPAVERERERQKMKNPGSALNLGAVMVAIIAAFIFGRTQK